MISDFDVIVLGAGMSGLVSASVLARQGVRRIAVIDEYAHLGGNHIDVSTGGYTFDVGSFIFQDDSPLLDHFPELLPLYIPIQPTFARLNPQGRVTKYPISVADDVLGAGAVECARMLLSAAKARLFPLPQRSAHSFARYWIGAHLLRRSGLEHYMERFYGVSADRIDIAFARARMGWIKEHARIATHVRRLLRPPAKSSNVQLARPREGFARLYETARARLESAGVQFFLAAALARLQRHNRLFTLEAAGHTFGAGRVVSTIPIPRLQALLGLPAAPLRTVTLISLFYSFSGARGFDQPVLFNFSYDGGWKRLTMHSDFYGRAAEREFLSVEVNADAVGHSSNRAAQDFRQHTHANRLFAGDLKLEGAHTLATAYPVYTDHAAERAEQAIAQLRSIGIESFGRQGGFDYQPTARASTLAAEAALAFPL